MISKKLLKSGFVKDFFRYYLAKIIPGLVGILVIPGILRLYGESVYGEYSLSISIIQTISTFFSAWLGRSFMRFYTSYQDQEYIHKRYNRIMNFFMIPIAVITIILLAGIRFQYMTILIGILCSILFTLYSYSSLKYQTFLRSGGVLYAEIIRSVIFFSLVFGIYYAFQHLSEHKINLILISNLLAFWAGNLMFSIMGKRAERPAKVMSPNPLIDKQIRDQLLHYGLPLALWMIGAFLLNISDRYILKIYFNFEEVGVYSSIYDTIFKMNTFLFMPIITSIQPRLIKYFNEGDFENSKKILNRALLLEFAILALVFLFFLFTRDFVVRQYLGFDSSEAVALVYPILFGAFFWNLATLFQKPLELAQMTRQMLFGILATLSLNVILNFIFIPRYGMQAAALTSLVSTLIYLLYVFILSRNKI
ncbi:MAG: oligosaccharide flippase family protein [Bacteroidales bacterium]|nr:oligosaccharide flippase family protein [Bacteroidales bacterium]